MCLIQQGGLLNEEHEEMNTAREKQWVTIIKKDT